MERRNAEGYHDPTAYGGMRMAEQKAEKETVRMVYKNGRMELYIHEFFPCRLAVARKVFPLIRRFAKEDDREKLKQFLRIKARGAFRESTGVFGKGGVPYGKIGGMAFLPKEGQGRADHL